MMATQFDVVAGRRQAFDHRQRAVGRTIINDDQFTLQAHRVGVADSGDHGGDGGLFVKTGDDDTERFHGRGFTLPGKRRCS